MSYELCTYDKYFKLLYDTWNLGYQMRYHLQKFSRGRAAAPRCVGTAHTPAAPASGRAACVYISWPVFGSTTVASPRMELLQEWERAK